MFKIVLAGYIMESKINPILTRNHPDFVDFLKRLQNDRVNEGKENTQTQIALWKLTKTITNYFSANEKSYKSLVDVDIKWQ